MPIIGGGGSGGGGSSAPGFEIGYDQITSNVNIVSAVEATPTTIITCAAHVFDGSPVLATFYGSVRDDTAAAGDATIIGLYESGTELFRFSYLQTPTTVGGLIISVCAGIRFTPTAATHTYTVGGAATSTTGTPAVLAAALGAAAFSPAYVRFTKV